MNTCFESEPQMPVSRGRVTTQSGRRKPGSSRSTSRIGVWARPTSKWLSVSGTGHGLGAYAVQEGFHDRDRTARVAAPSTCRRGPAAGRIVRPCRTFEIRIVDEASAEDRAALEDEINEFNFAGTGYRDGRSLSCFLRDDDGEARRRDRRLHLGRLRAGRLPLGRRDAARSRLGQRLLEAAEAEAKARGCRTIVVSSHEFQAPDMYRRLGYEEIGVAVDAPIGARHFHFQKVLCRRADQSVNARFSTTRWPSSTSPATSNEPRARA